MTVNDFKLSLLMASIVIPTTKKHETQPLYSYVIFLGKDDLA